MKIMWIYIYMNATRRVRYDSCINPPSEAERSAVVHRSGFYYVSLYTYRVFESSFLGVIIGFMLAPLIVSHPCLILGLNAYSYICGSEVRKRKCLVVRPTRGMEAWKYRDIKL